MHSRIQIVVVGLLAAGLMACGSDPSEVTCAEGTEYDEEAGECRLERPECGEGEEYVEASNECASVAENYCAEGTEYDADQEACVADSQLECGEGTVAEGGECVPGARRSCGEGTTLHDGECLPDEEVCGEQTEDETDGEGVSCRPVDDQLCGEGAEFDEFTRVCVPESELECGPGTVAVDGECRPARSYYESLADEADLELTGDDEPGTIQVPDTGGQFVFTGTIDAPQVEDGDHVQDVDDYEFSAEAGQWLEITVYSLGLPEPGFEVEQLDAGDAARPLYRRSDLGAGLEVSRQIVAPADSDYRLGVGNMPQMHGDRAPAGGEDWNYVGIVETVERPQARPIDIFDETAEGDLREPSRNLYSFDEMGDVESIQMLFDQLPEDAVGEFQIWTDDTTRAEVYELGREVSFEPPADSFDVLFDYTAAEGAATDYRVTGRRAIPIAADATGEFDVELEAGEYLSVSQYNTAGEPLAATIVDEQGDSIAETDTLRMWDGQETGRYLHGYSGTDQTVTVQLHNTTGSDLESVASNIEVRSADSMQIDDGSLRQLEYPSSLEAGQRHFVELEIDYDDLLAISLEDAPANSMWLYDGEGQQVIEGSDVLAITAEPGSYLLVVEAEDAMPSGFTLAVEETDIFTVRESSEPVMPIPTEEEPAVDTVTVDSCPTIQDIEVDVEITHDYRGDLEVDITAPGGDTVRIHDETGGLTNNIVATYPNPDDDGLEDGSGLLDFVDTDGSGEWTITVVDKWATSVSNGDLESWAVQLTCEQ